MAISSYSVVVSETNKVWRTVESEMIDMLPAMCPEYENMEQYLPDEPTNYSVYSTQIVVDLYEGGGVSSITPGGAKTRPSSPNVERGTMTMLELNKRFATTMLTQWADNSASQIKRELKHKAAHALRSVANDIGDRFYGTSTGILALTDTDLSGTTDTLTLYDGYGTSTIDNPAFIADKFRVGDYVAALNAGTLVTDAVGVITAINTSTPTISVTWQGSTSESTNGIQIVKANSLEVAAAADTDYNKSFVGLIDATRTQSVHSIDSSAITQWTVGFSDTTGGRIDGVRLRQGEDALNDYGAKLEILAIDKAVYRDWMDSERGILRHSDPLSMETDGDIKSRGRKFLKTKRSIPGEIIGWQKGAIRKWELKRPDGNFNWSDGMESEDYSRILFNLPVAMAMVVRQRKHIAYWTGLDRHGA